MKTNSLILGTALLASALGAIGCSGDDTNPVVPTNAGADATATKDAGGTVDAGGGDSAIPEDAGTGEASASDAGDAATPSYALFVGTDYTKAELSVVSLDTNTVSGNLALADQDSVAYANGGLGFVLEHGVGDVLLLNSAQPWTVGKTIDINDAVDAAPYASNPYAFVITSGAKAYVARYNTNSVKIIDLPSGTSGGTIDLSSFAATDDTDGTIEVADGAFDATTNRVYFLLQRIDQLNYPLTCIASHGLIVAVDATNDTIVDLNGAAAGQGIDLLGYDPQSLTADFANGRLLVSSSGCAAEADGGAGVDAGTFQAGMGVESVTITAATSTWLYQPAGDDSLQGFVWVDATHAFLNNGTRWFSWNPTQPTLGTAVTGFPGAPAYDGNGRIIGLSSQEADAGSDAGIAWSVVAFDVATSQVSTIVQAPFKTVSPKSFGISTAILH